MGKISYLPDDIDFEKYLTLREYSDIRSPTHWRDEVAAEFSGNNKTAGELLPWSKTHEAVQFRPGEVTLWAGINGHFKSFVTGMVALWMLPTSKVCVASLEMPPQRTLQRMIRQSVGVNDVSEAYQGHFLDWAHGRLWLYDRADEVPVKTILGMISYCATQLGITQVFIDSLMKCGVDEEDKSAVKRFIDQLCQLAKQLKIHIHLVAHMKKGENEYKRPGKFDVFGSSMITNLIDNLCVVHANKLKQEKIQSKQPVDETEPDITLTWAKQRHGEFEGTFNFWMHKASGQIITNHNNRTMQFNIGFRHG